MPFTFELPEPNGTLQQAQQQQKTTASETNKVITIQNLQYSATMLTIKKGSKVTWKNIDNYRERENVPHMVIEKNNRFRSPRLNTGQSFSYTFTEKGTYEFFDPMYVKSTIESEVEELSSGEDSLLEGYIIVE